MAAERLTELARRIADGERAALARAITLVESRRPAHRADAAALVQELLPRTGRAVRVGITGAPGVGKSTLIDALGQSLVTSGERVAVLAVDPSSTRTGGAILGDKTRMGTLAASQQAFIRPSPSAGSLGGVAARTREAMLLVEAAGFTVVVVETVGVGQSELAVADMVDTFVALMLPGAGDELQGIKKGLVEQADIIVVNKADGDALPAARRAAAELLSAVKILASEVPPEVMTVSARTGERLDALWQAVVRHRAGLEETGRLCERRRSQNVVWMRDMIADGLNAFLAERAGGALVVATEAVRDGRLAPSAAAASILARLAKDDAVEAH
ncbi:methylmalonyl Co-A mutase-associated GTPase MeaB [Acuticoccus sp.]|uniref:methylmalonyl Co-A mutase-associated GTPase MeaB n=1 Tax=Acuticoccus sp. TaxID=1904378 RepID=UPI003B52CA9E